MDSASSAWPNALLDRMQYEADPLADDTIAAIMDPWQGLGDECPACGPVEANAPQWERLQLVSRMFEDWTDNRSIARWVARPDTPPDVACAIAAYLEAGRALPAWADTAKIERAEALFMDYGVLSCVLLFCASLPECYVIPDLSQALHVTGQLAQHTEHRIRATAAMIFPVMMKGGLTADEGGGIAQVLKVRLIHATIRHLILRGTPNDAVAALGSRRRVADALVLPRLDAPGARNMHQALFAHGWNVGKDGLPCNQEELAYTLLTFHYVFLRGLRTLGIGLRPQDEDAFLHAWNVMGHMLGIGPELMVHTMEDAEVLFRQIQTRGRSEPFSPDPRPHLGQALMQTMERMIPLRLAKPIPRLLTRHLCGRATARDIGIATKVSWAAQALFVVLLVIVRSIDGLVRLFDDNFSISRFITRLIGRQFMAKLLMDETRPLKLPVCVADHAHQLMAGWHHDPKAPRWMNALERKLKAAHRAPAAH